MSPSIPQVQQFPQTRWTLIRRVSEGTPEEVKQALDELCRSYWYPLYAIARMKGAGPEEAADYVQGFFAHGLANGLFAKLVRSLRVERKSPRVNQVTRWRL